MLVIFLCSTTAVEALLCMYAVSSDAKVGSGCNPGCCSKSIINVYCGMCGGRKQKTKKNSKERFPLQYESAEGH